MIKITKAPIKKEELKLKRDKELQKFKVEIASQDIVWEVSFLERLNVWLNIGLKQAKLIWKIIEILLIIRGFTMSETKKSTKGFIKIAISFVVMLLAYFNINVPEEMVTELVAGLISLWGAWDIYRNRQEKKKDEDAGNDNG